MTRTHFANTLEATTEWWKKMYNQCWYSKVPLSRSLNIIQSPVYLVDRFQISLLRRWRCDCFKIYKEFNVDRIRLNTGTQCDAEIRFKLNDATTHIRDGHVSNTQRRFLSKEKKCKKIMPNMYANEIFYWNCKESKKRMWKYNRARARVHKCFIQRKMIKRIKKKEKYNSSIEEANWMCDVYGIRAS